MEPTYVYAIGQGLGERPRFEVAETNGTVIEIMDRDDDIAARIVERNALGTVFETHFAERFLIAAPNDSFERRLYACDWRFAGYQRIAH